jgi:hypothetical protein
VRLEKHTPAVSALKRRFCDNEPSYARPPLSAALICRGYWCGLRRDGQRPGRDLATFILACQQKFSPNERTDAMNDGNEDPNQTDEEILRDEVSDQAVEAAFGALREFPTLWYGTYCFVLQARRIVANIAKLPDLLR